LKIFLKNLVVIIKKKKEHCKKRRENCESWRNKFHNWRELKNQHGNEKIHWNVSCDGCNQAPLIGDRYKCESCKDFDFCSKCYKEGKHDKNHKFKII